MTTIRGSYNIVTCHGCEQTWALDFQPDCSCMEMDGPMPESTFCEVKADSYEQAVHKVIMGIA